MKKLTLFLFLILLLSCGKSDVETIKIDVDNVMPLDTSMVEAVTLQEDSVFVSAQISRIIEVDSSYIVVGGDKVASYDLDGRFVRNLLFSGKSANEFLMIFDVIVQDDGLYFIDQDIKVIHCDRQGNYIDSKMLDNRLFSVEKFKDGYLVVSDFEGGAKFLDSKFEFVCDVNTIIPVVKKVYGYEMSYCADKEVLMKRMYDKTVYSIDRELKMRKKYLLDFGSAGVPDNDSPTAEWNENLVQYTQVTESDEFLYTQYYYKGSHINKYDKGKKTSVNYLIPESCTLSMEQPGEPFLMCRDENGTRIFKNFKI